MHMPWLLFEFRNTQGTIERLCFREPVKVLCTETLSEVRPLLREVQDWTRQGFYAAGYLAYEAAQAFDPALPEGKPCQMPLLWFGIFEFPSPAPQFPESSKAISLPWRTQLSEEDYQQNIAHLKKWITEGETYQANYTLRLTAPFTGHPFHYYQQLTRAQKGDYSAFLDLGRFQILSASPELFFHWDGQKITTRPMKGTAPRGRFLEEDDLQRQFLKTSEKNRAENLMIVDLIRNDLSRIAIPGSVKVSKLFEVEKYQTLWTMTSTIQAETHPGTQLEDILEALFPCGSITGAPKISTMHLLSRLESSARQVYCGAIGYLTPEGEAIFNVPIRTVITDDELEQAEYGVGGGITWDSDPSDEYQEVLTKSLLLTYQQPQFSLVETLHLQEGQYPLVREHINKMIKSARYWGYPEDAQTMYEVLYFTSEQHPEGEWLVDLHLDSSGEVQTQIRAFPAEPLPFRVADEPLLELDTLHFHRTQQNLDEELLLLYHDDGLIAQFNQGNLVAKLGEELFTPVLEDRWLTCPMLIQLLKTEQVQEIPMSLDWLAEHPEAQFFLADHALVPVRFAWNS
ncbi:aminodeoxychorismate synthase component I [Deinococcus roseus]|uniref:Aminodeoxychorismate synthase, component I n=1 Tax=Deinococcus roseus TaxID=392414 RepID=A0ABQ2CY34_9DEIO|nr:aminodeoxychorismate synthase component I [Deinococcus roseus]GGJ25547.1 aminodeoxychorismate synthase, component I [Deinococcus roseus]